MALVESADWILSIYPLVPLSSSTDSLIDNKAHKATENIYFV